MTVSPFAFPAIKLPPELAELSKSIKTLVDISLPELSEVIDKLRVELKRCNNDNA